MGRSPRLLLAAATALVLAAGLALPAGATAGGAGPARPEGVVGRTGTPEPARRIVSLAPHITELLFAAGAGDRIVGASAWSDHPEAARAIPRIGDSHAFDIERILALRPDLAVAWGAGHAPRPVAAPGPPRAPGPVEARGGRSG